MLDGPTDKAAVGVTALEARVRACTTEDELHAITGDAKVAKQRAWLAENRPELDARLAEALGPEIRRDRGRPAGDGGSCVSWDDLWLLWPSALSWGLTWWLERLR
jgi:hypothetical protein